MKLWSSLTLDFPATTVSLFQEKEEKKEAL